MAGKIFINYRRGDAPDSTGRLYDRLEAEFGGANLFMDVEGHIKPGDDFVRVLDAQVAASDIVLVVIGPRWAELLKVRDGDPDDFVAIEIKSALEREKRVIPVLVGGAAMPRADTLPESFRALARRNAVGLRSERFKVDVQSLISALKQQLDDVQKERDAKNAAERQSLESARKKREEEEAAKVVAAELEARRQTLAGMYPAEIRKAQEIANWYYTEKKGPDIAALRDHIARYPGGETEHLAAERLEKLVWENLARDERYDFHGFEGEPDAEALDAFLTEFPKGTYAPEARRRLDELLAEKREADLAEARGAQETAEWAAIAGGTDQSAIRAFVRKWPSGKHAKAANERLKELGGSKTRRWLLQGAGAAATAGVAAIFVPGNLGWRMLYDQSVLTFTGHTDGVRSVAFSPDGKAALSGGDDNIVLLWYMTSGKAVQTLVGHTDGIYSVAFSQNSRNALSGGSDKTLILWDIDTGRKLRGVPFEGHIGNIYSVAFSPDGMTALSGSNDGTLRLLDVASGKEVRTFTGPSTWVRSVVFSPDGKAALSGGDDNIVRLWDLASGKEVRTLSHSHYVTSVTFSPDGDRVLSGSLDGILKLWDRASGVELLTFTGHTGAIFSVAFSPDGKTALSGSADKTLKLWDRASGVNLRTFTGHAGAVYSVAFSPDGKTALSGSADKTLKLWDLTR